MHSIITQILFILFPSKLTHRPASILNQFLTPSSCYSRKPCSKMKDEDSVFYHSHRKQE